MSSLVQRQSERQGIFFIALSPFKRGAGGVKYQPYLFSSSLLSHPPIFSSLSYSASPLCRTPPLLSVILQPLLSSSGLESIVAKNKPEAQFEAYETKGAHYPVMGIYTRGSKPNQPS